MLLMNARGARSLVDAPPGRVSSVNGIESSFATLSLSSLATLAVSYIHSIYGMLAARFSTASLLPLRPTGLLMTRAFGAR